LLVEELAEKNIPIKILGNTKKSIGHSKLSIVNEDEETTVQYDIYIEKTAEPTVYHIPLKVIWSSDFSVEEFEDSELLYFGIKVSEDREAEIDVVDFSLTPEKLKPGEKGHIEIELKNVGGTMVQSLNVKLIPKSPITPFNSDLEEYITEIDPNESVTVRFDIAVEDLVGNSIFYELPLILEYEDKFGVHVKNTTVGVEIAGEPKVLIHEISLEPSKLTIGTEGMFLVTLINTGSESAENVKVKISGGENILTEEHQFIGEIMPGDTQTTTFGVNIGEDADIGEHGLRMDITYEDRFGKSYFESKTYVLSVFYAEPFIPTEYIYAIIALAVFLVVGYLALMLRKIGKERKQKMGE